MDEKKISECPLCMEVLDEDEINFYPCSCHYQICKFCWNKIQGEENGRCPACRKEYSEDTVEFKIPSYKNKKAASRKQNKNKRSFTSEEKKYLTSVRVVQKNLIIVNGLSPKLMNTKLLQSDQYFGKYGKINYIYLVSSTHSLYNPSGKAYITYQCSDEAVRAILSTNCQVFDGQKIRVEMGTTSYCTNFLNSIPCKFPECSFMHEIVEKDATFTKEEIRKEKHIVYISDLLKQFESCPANTFSITSKQAPIKRPFFDCTQKPSDNTKSFKAAKLLHVTNDADVWTPDLLNFVSENKTSIKFNFGLKEK